MFVDLPNETLYAYPLPIISNQEDTKNALKSAKFFVSSAPTAIYIHIPYCLFLCEFCGFIKTNKFSPEEINKTVDFIKKEIKITAEFLDNKKIDVSAIFFGGGTASILSAKQVASIMDTLSEVFNILADAEMTFEGECLTLRKKNFLNDIAAVGFNRVSFGVQTMDVDVRKILNLRPSIESLADLSLQAKEVFEEVCVDFIYGWPGQSMEHVKEDIIKLVSELSPDTIEVFQFEKQDASPFFLKRLYDNGINDLKAELIQKQYMLLKELLINYGYFPKNYTKFSKSTVLSGTTYTNCYYGYNNGNVIGICRGSQSFYNGIMWANNLTSDEYEEAIKCETIPAGVFSHYSLNERESVTWPRRGYISKLLTNQLNQIYNQKIQVLITNKYIIEDNENFTLTQEGLNWIPSILRYLMPKDQINIFDSYSNTYLP